MYGYIPAGARKNNLKKKQTKKKQITYQENLKKQIKWYKKKNTPKMYGYIPAGPKKKTI